MINTDEATIEIEAGTADLTTQQEIYRNLQILYATHTGEQALDRDFGIDVSIMDNQTGNAQALLVAEYVRKTKTYEPRAQVARVEWESSTIEDGILIPKVVIEIV